MKNINKKRQGFTLIELLLYVAIAGAIMTSISLLIFQVTQSRAKIQTISDIKDEADLIINQITKKVKEADSITLPAAGENSGNLTLTMSDLAKSPTVFALSEGKIVIKEGAGDAIDLSSSRLEVTDLDFESTLGANPGGVRASFTLRFEASETRFEYNYQKDFDTFIIPRK